MTCSLGLDAVTACAAARSGLTRSLPLDCFSVQSPEDGSIEAAIGHPAPLVTAGFEGNARLVRLMQAALTDLLRNIDRPPENKRTAFYLSLPDPDRLGTGKNLMQEEGFVKKEEPETVSEDDDPSNDTELSLTEEEEEIEKDDDTDGDDLFVNLMEESTEPYRIGTKAQAMLQKAAQLSGWSQQLQLRGVAVSGNTGVAEVVQNAIHDLSSGEVDCAIVGGVDSWLDENLLMWLEDTGRLKTPASPVGFQPGEAAAFMLLQNMQIYEACPCRGFTSIIDVRIGEEQNTLLSGTISKGRVLANLLAETAEPTRWSQVEAPWLIVDQNGEIYRALEWGNASVHLLSKNAAFVSPILWCPAASFGDTGAASGAVAISTAIRAFARNYALHQEVAVVSSSDGACRSVILLRHVSSQP